MTDVAVAAEARLVPLIQIEPGALVHEGSLDEGEADESWESRWRRRMEELGAKAPPLSPHGYSCVEVSQAVDASTLEVAVRAGQQELWAWIAAGAKGRVGEALEMCEGLGGGFVLLLDGDAFIDPGCCAGLEDIAEWVALAEHRGQGEERVWVGHDRWTLAGSFDGPSGQLVLRRGGEGYNRAEPERVVRVPAGVMLGAVEGAVGELSGLCERLVSLLTPRVGEPRASAIARRLSGLDDRSLWGPAWTRSAARA